MLLTVAELPSYLRVAAKWIAEDERKEIVHHLAAHPSAGVLIQGTGGFASYAGPERVGARAAGCG